MSDKKQQTSGSLPHPSPSGERAGSGLDGNRAEAAGTGSALEAFPHKRDGWVGVRQADLTAWMEAHTKSVRRLAAAEKLLREVHALHIADAGPCETAACGCVWGRVAAFLSESEAA